MIKQTARWAVLVPLFAIPFLALYISSDLFFPFIAGKNFAFRALVEIALAGYIVLALMDRRYRPRFSWILAAFALLVVWMALADAVALNSHKAFWSNFERMDGYITLIHLFVLFVVGSAFLTVENLWRRWWMTLVAATALVTGFGVLQALGAAEIHQSATRLDSTLGNSEYLAGFLLIAIAVTLWQAFESPKGWLRNGLFALVVLEFLILLGTGTRGTFIAIILAALIGGFLWLLSLGGKGRKGALGFLAAVLVFAGGFYAIRNTAFVQESPNLSRFANISVDSLDVRFKIWNMAVEGIKDRPLLGWGHEGFNYVFYTYYDPEMYGQEPWFDRAHNIYLDWAIAGGIPALLLFLLLGGAALLAIYRSEKLEPWERVLLLSAIIAYAIQGLAVFDNLFTYIPIIMLLAYAHSLAGRPIAKLENVRELKGAMLDTVAAPVVLVIALATLYFVNVPTYAAGKDLIDGLRTQNDLGTRLEGFKSALERDPFASQEIREQLLQFAQSVDQSDSPAQTKSVVGMFASIEMEKEIARAPSDVRLYSLYASFLRTHGDLAKARQMAAKAREFAPLKQTVIIEQGIIEWQSGEYDAARRFFAEAYELSPNAEELAVYAAAGHIVTGDIPGGKALLQTAYGTTSVNHMVLALAYQEVKAWDDLIATMQTRYREQHDATTGFQVAIAYAQAGRLEAARAQVRAVMTEFPAASAQGAQLLTQLGAR